MYFAAITTLLVEELNRYFQQNLDALSDGPSAVCDVTGFEMFQLERYLAANGTLLHTFVCQLMKSGRFLPFLWYLRLSNSGSADGNNDSNYDRVWKLKHLFWCTAWSVLKLLLAFWTSGYEWADVAFQKKNNFETIHPQKKICFGMQICFLCDMPGYTHGMNVGLERDGTRASAHLSANYTAVKHLKGKEEGHRHKLYMDLLLSPSLFDDITERRISCSRTVTPNGRGI